MLVNLSEGGSTADGGSGNLSNNNNNTKQPFNRSDRASASVRLRTKKSEGPVNGNGKKRNRHSGDFSFFSSSKVDQPCSSVSPSREVKKEGDWAYITFPNGVPTVQDIKTNVGPVSQREAVMRPQPMIGQPMLVPGSRASVHLSHGMLNKRMSSDFSSQQFISLNIPNHDVRPRQSGAGVIMRQRPGLPGQQMGNFRNSCYIEAQPSSGARHVTQVTVTNSPQQSPDIKRPLSSAAANVIFRRKQNTPSQAAGAAQQGGVAKRCSGEFDFVRNGRRASLMLLDSPEGKGADSDVVRVQIRDGSYPSPDLVANQTPVPRPEVRQPGLGRRAVTQINIRHKKNSYNAAICKSQENLVKAMSNTEDDDLEDSDLRNQDSADQSLEKRSTTTVKKGLLWQQRDKFFSQWKERYFILTSDYLQCFKKGTSRITEMGEFIYKIKLCELDEVELIDRRGYLVLCVTLQKEGKVYFRKTEGIRDWYNSLKECTEESKRRRSERSSKSFWSTKQLTDSSNIDKWIQAKKKIGLQYSYINDSKAESPSRPGVKSEITLDELSDLYRCEEEEEKQKSSEPKKSNSPKAESSNSPKIFSPQNRSSQVVQLRVSGSRDDLSCKPYHGNISKHTKKINRLSLMSDLELSELNHDIIGLDLDKGLYLRQRSNADIESNDSGNNSMNTNGSVASSNSSHSHHSNPREPRLETHLESDQPDEEIEQQEQSKPKGNRRRSRDENGRKYFGGSRRPASHVMPNGLQVTHV